MRIVYNTSHRHVDALNYPPYLEYITGASYPAACLWAEEQRRDDARQASDTSVQCDSSCTRDRPARIHCIVNSVIGILLCALGGVNGVPCLHYVPASSHALTLTQSHQKIEQAGLDT